MLMSKSSVAAIVGLCSALVFGFNANVQANVTLEENEYLVFYHHDALGSPAAATDEKGHILWRESSTPFGKSAGKTSDSGQSFVESNGADNETRLGYTGHSFDAGSGLVYMKARFYDSAIGRFYSNDPIGFYIGNISMFNRFAYVNNNPYKYIDPNGEESYLVSRPLAPPIVSKAASHNFVVTNADFIGDPNATVHSFGDTGDKNGNFAGPVDDLTEGQSKGTSKRDRDHWESLANDQNLAKQDTTSIPAKDALVDHYAKNVKQNKKYKLLPVPLDVFDSANSPLCQASCPE